MDRNDWITLSKLTIKKYDGDPQFQEQIDEMKEDTKRMKLLSPVERRKKLSKELEKKLIKNFEKLGIAFVEIKPFQ